MGSFQGGHREAKLLLGAMQKRPQRVMRTAHSSLPGSRYIHGCVFLLETLGWRSGIGILLRSKELVVGHCGRGAFHMGADPTVQSLCSTEWRVYLQTSSGRQRGRRFWGRHGRRPRSLQGLSWLPTSLRPMLQPRFTRAEFESPHVRGHTRNSVMAHHYTYADEALTAALVNSSCAVEP